MLRMPRPCLIGVSGGKHMDCAWPHAHEGMGARELACMQVHCSPADESACGETEQCPGGGGGGGGGGAATIRQSTLHPEDKVLPCAEAPPRS